MEKYARGLAAIQITMHTIMAAKPNGHANTNP